MFSQKNVYAALLTCLIAVSGVALGGAKRSLSAEESNACVIGGNGPLCRQVQTQECVEWKLATVGGGPTSISVGMVCAKWETRTTYYYNDQGSGGVTIKPKPLM